MVLHISNGENGLSVRNKLNDVIDIVNTHLSSFAITDPIADAAVTTAVIDAYSGVVVTLTAAPTSQVMQALTTATIFKQFVVVNDSISTNDLVVTYGSGASTVIVDPGHGQKFFWVGAEWTLGASLDASDISSLPQEWLAGTDVQANITELLKGSGITLIADTVLTTAYSRYISNSLTPLSHTLPAITTGMIGIKYSFMNINLGSAKWSATGTDTIVGYGTSIAFGKGSSTEATPVELSAGVYGWML